MSFITTSSLVFLAAFLAQNLLTLKLNKIEYMTCSLIQGQVVKNQLFHQLGRRLSGSLSKSGPLDFGTKNNFPSFFVSEKGLVHICKKPIYYFPVSYFCFATSQN